MIPTRRRFLARSAALGATSLGATSVFAQPRPQWTARQFHNQPEQSHQHEFLVSLWDAVRAETNGRFACTVFAQNANIPGSDPAALKMLISGELEFFTLMGGILGKEVPVTEIQGLPFAFTSHEQVHRIMDGELGNYLRREMADRLRREARVPVGTHRTDREADLVLHRPPRARVIDVVRILLRHVHDRVEADAPRVPRAGRRAEDRVRGILMPRERIRLQRPGLADVATAAVGRRHAGIQHDELLGVARGGHNARLLHLLRLPRSRGAVDEADAADGVGGETRGRCEREE